METVTIETVEYEVYAGIETADEYLAADFLATTWRAETDEDQKARALVTATRLLDRTLWIGTKEDEDQLHAWPRTGTGLSDIDDDEVPQEITDASIVLAKLIHAGSPVVTAVSSASNVKRQQAGSVSQEFFSPIIMGEPGRWPQEVLELIRRYISGAGFLGGSIATGVCGQSAFDPDYRTSGPL